jgi:hypothetical protein
MIPCLMLLLLAQDVYLAPDSYFVSPGERVRVVVEGGEVSKLTDPSMYTLTGAYNMLNLRREEGATVVFASIKGPGTPVLAIRTAAGGAKALVLSADHPDEAFQRRVGHVLEIVPEVNPYSVKVGGLVPVVVLLHGKGVGGVAVKGGRDAAMPEIGRTDDAGRVVIPLTGVGKWRVAASDRGLAATLTFEVR